MFKERQCECEKASDTASHVVSYMCLMDTENTAYVNHEWTISSGSVYIISIPMTLAVSKLHYLYY